MTSRRDFLIRTGLTFAAAALASAAEAPRTVHAQDATDWAAVLRSAAAYLGGDPRDIALTDSTTMGLGLLYTGVDLQAGQEIITTTHDFYATHEALRYAAAC